MGQRYDCCVVGAGIAGALVAERLSRAGKSVILLDQGPRVDESFRHEAFVKGRSRLNDAADYNDDTPKAHTSDLESIRVPDSATHRGIEYKNWRVFGTGGTTLHFDGYMGRPRAEELLRRSKLGFGRDWSLGYDALEPWLCEAEAAIGVAGGENPYASARSRPLPMPAHPYTVFDREVFAGALRKLGAKGHSAPRAVNSAPYGGRPACQACRACTFCPSGAKFAVDRVILKALADRENVTVRPGTHVRRVILDGPGGRARGVAAVDVLSGKAFTIDAASVVLAAGGVENPRLLLLSEGAGPHARGLGHANGQVGQHFSDHLWDYAVMQLPRAVGPRRGFETMMSDHFRAHPYRGEGLSLLAMPLHDLMPLGAFARTWAPPSEGRLDLTHFRRAAANTMFVWTLIELDGEGRLGLSSAKRDAYGDPVASVGMRLSQRDVARTDAFSALAKELAAAMGAQNVSGPFTHEEVRKGVLSNTDFGPHPSGATALGHSPESSVCDMNLRVHGTQNVFVTGSSVFPHQGPFPPTLTIAALSIRLGEHLKGAIEA